MITSIQTTIRHGLFFSGILVASCLLGFAPVASGTTIDPTIYATGTDISTATAGVILSAPGNGTAVYAAPFFTLDTMASFIGYKTTPPYYGTSFVQASPLRADFTSPVSSVSVDFETDPSDPSIQFLGWGAVLYAYNAGGIQIDSSTASSTGGGSLAATVSAPDISYILAYFIPTQSNPDVAGITLIQFQTTSVPDGGDTLALLATAVTALFFVRKLKLA